MSDMHPAGIEREDLDLLEPKPKFQFSLKSLLMFTTAAAVICAIGSWMCLGTFALTFGWVFNLIGFGYFGSKFAIYLIDRIPKNRPSIRLMVAVAFGSFFMGPYLYCIIGFGLGFALLLDFLFKGEVRGVRVFNDIAYTIYVLAPSYFLTLGLIATLLAIPLTWLSQISGLLKNRKSRRLPLALFPVGSLSLGVATMLTLLIFHGKKELLGWICFSTFAAFYGYVVLLVYYSNIHLKEDSLVYRARALAYAQEVKRLHEAQSTADADSQNHLPEQ